jgi:large subunit ribosomal protein L14
MIQEETELEVADNTGAQIVQCFRVYGGSKRKYAGPGDIIMCSVKKAAPNSAIKKGEKVKCIVVRTKAPIERADGVVLRFGTNAVVIVDDKGNPKGTRVFGGVAREVRKKHPKICSLAPEVL